MSDSGWGKYSLGNILHGPGSYYLNDSSITQMFPEITTEMEAWMIVRLLAEESVDNPPVMWQLTKIGDGPSHLILHRRKFFDQNLYADTGKIYHGKVISYGGKMYSTKSGALENSSKSTEKLFSSNV